jgi:hypothetical protein
MSGKPWVPGEPLQGPVPGRHVSQSAENKDPAGWSVSTWIFHRCQTAGPLSLPCTIRGPCEEGGGHGVCWWVRSPDISTQLLLGGEKTVDMALRQAIELQAILLAAGLWKTSVRTFWFWQSWSHPNWVKGEIRQFPR